MQISYFKATSLNLYFRPISVDQMLIRQFFYLHINSSIIWSPYYGVHILYYIGVDNKYHLSIRLFIHHLEVQHAKWMKFYEYWSQLSVMNKYVWFTLIMDPWRPLYNCFIDFTIANYLLITLFFSFNWFWWF